MATITSAGSGNFSAGATWVGGVAPVNGDGFIIAVTHTVVVDNATLIPVTGYAASSISGILQHAATGVSTLRMDGSLTVANGGTYHMRGNALLEFRGTTIQFRGLVINGAASTSLIIEGADGMQSTTLSANADNGVTSFSVASSANFAIGEWIAVFDNTTAQAGNAGAATLRDEGFWIHDISGNTIYFRQYVSPTDTIVSTSGSTVTTLNAKVWRVGQKIIFGTGANRNIKTITAINYPFNTITVDSAITGSVVGQTIYETGTDKIHTSGNKVRKVATYATTFSASTSTQITLANATSFAVGDEIWVQAVSECGGQSDYAWNAYPSYIKTIQSISGNTITLNAAVGYNVTAGALVTRMTRNVQIRTVTDTDFAYIYLQNFTSNYTRKLIMKDVYCRRMGWTSANEARGIVLMGHTSTNSLPVAISQTVPAFSQQAWIEGVSMTAPSAATGIDWGGFFFFNSRYLQGRCCTVVGTYQGFGVYYQGGQCAYNCISAGNPDIGFRVEGQSEWWEVAYSYSSRNNIGCRLIPAYEDGCGHHHFISDATFYSIAQYSSFRGPALYKHQHTGTSGGIYCEVAQMAMLYGKLSFLSGTVQPYSTVPGTNQVGYYYQQIDRGSIQYQTFNIIEANFEYDRMEQYGYYTMRVWDSNENAWRVYFKSNASEGGAGWFESIFVPSGASLRVTCQVKLPSFYSSASYPTLEVRSTQSNVGPNQLQNVGGQWNNWVSGGSAPISYTAAALNNYETKTLTVTAVNFPRYLQAGIWGTDATQSEGWWQTNMTFTLDTPYAIPPFRQVNTGAGPMMGKSYDINPSFVAKKVRVKGRTRLK